MRRTITGIALAVVLALTACTAGGQSHGSGTIVGKKTGSCFCGTSYDVFVRPAGSTDVRVISVTKERYRELTIDRPFSW